MLFIDNNMEAAMNIIGARQTTTAQTGRAAMTLITRDCLKMLAAAIAIGLAIAIVAASLITASSVSLAYRCVVTMLACPRTCCSAASDPPRSNHWHANV